MPMGLLTEKTEILRHSASAVSRPRSVLSAESGLVAFDESYLARGMNRCLDESDIFHFKVHSHLPIRVCASLIPTQEIRLTNLWEFPHRLYVSPILGSWLLGEEGRCTKMGCGIYHVQYELDIDEHGMNVNGVIEPQSFSTYGKLKASRRAVVNPANIAMLSA